MSAADDVELLMSGAWRRLNENEHLLGQRILEQLKAERAATLRYKQVAWIDQKDGGLYYFVEGWPPPNEDCVPLYRRVTEGEGSGPIVVPDVETYGASWPARRRVTEAGEG